MHMLQLHSYNYTLLISYKSAINYGNILHCIQIDTDMKDMPKKEICLDMQGGVLYVQSYVFNNIFGIFNSLYLENL